MAWDKNWMPGKFEKYRQRVRDVAAFRYGREAEPEWYKKMIAIGPRGGINDSEHGVLKIQTDAGWQTVPEGAWVMCDHDGRLSWEFHDRFVENYEPTPEYAKLIP